MLVGSNQEPYSALRPSASPSPFLSLFLVLGRGTQFVSAHCSYLIRLCILAFSAQLHTVGCTDLSGLDLPQFSKEKHTANEETVPSLATALSGAAPGPKPEAGFKGAISPPGLPHSRHRSFPPSTPFEGESLKGQRGRLRLSPARFDRRTDGERAAGTGPVFGNAAAQSVIAKSREFSIKHKDGGKPCLTQLSVNVFVRRPAMRLTPNILTIPQLMARALSAPTARPADRLKTKRTRSFQLAGSLRRETRG